MQVSGTQEIAFALAADASGLPDGQNFIGLTFDGWYRILGGYRIAGSGALWGPNLSSTYPAQMPNAFGIRKTGNQYEMFAGWDNGMTMLVGSVSTTVVMRHFCMYFGRSQARVGALRRTDTNVSLPW
jgi:hypothetical protein